MLTYCSIVSGEAPQVPVASSKSGTVFEKRLIEAYIAEHGKDPVTGEELNTDDLIELKSKHYLALGFLINTLTYFHSCPNCPTATTNSHQHTVPPLGLSE